MAKKKSASPNSTSGRNKDHGKTTSVVKKKRRVKKKAIGKKRTGENATGSGRKASKKYRAGAKKKVAGKQHQLFFDWSKMEGQWFHTELFRQLNLPKSQREDFSRQNVHAVTGGLYDGTLKTAKPPYHIVNINVSLVPYVERTPAQRFINWIKSVAENNPGSQIVIHEEGLTPTIRSTPDPAELDRKLFIQLIASGQWPILENEDIPAEEGPARDNELKRLDEIHNKFTMEFVTTSTSSDELHLFVESYDWTRRYQYLFELIQNPVCELNTALLVFWQSGADYFQRHYNKPPHRDLYGGYHRQAWDLIQKIRKNVESGKYKESTAPDGFKEKVVVVPPEKQLWEIDAIMYGGVGKKYRRKRTSKKKHITTKRAAAKTKNQKKYICRTNKTLLQLHLDQLNGETASKIQYFLEIEHRINGSEESHSQLEACHISEDVAQGVSSYMVLYFDSQDRLTEIRRYYETNTPEEHVHDPWLQKTVETADHRYRQYEIVEGFEFVPNKRGKSRIGGSPPTGFITPVLSSGIALQYLGLLSHSDAAFRLRHDFHLVYPLHIDFCLQVWIDYKNPMAPTVINDNEISDLEGGDPDEDENIILDLCQFKTVPWPTKTRHGGHTGLPRWIQGPEIPVCPETNEKMELICQLGDGDLSSSEKKKSVLGSKLGRYEGSRLRAFDDGWLPVDGDLFVFFSRKSRLACYLYQGT
jgi:hypothetical protein